MAPKKSAEKSPKTVVARTNAAEGEPQAAVRPKATRRRAAAPPSTDAAATPSTDAAATPSTDAAATASTGAAATASTDVAPVAGPPARPTSAARKVAPAVESASVAATAIAATPSRRVTDEDIRVRAYFLALESQGRGGSLDYWLRAERELRASQSAD